MVWIWILQARICYINIDSCLAIENVSFAINIDSGFAELFGEKSKCLIVMPVLTFFCSTCGLFVWVDCGACWHGIGFYHLCDWL